jgi:murein DD-endopeptidase MepM/ murein hydrolase activator NlpD
MMDRRRFLKYAALGATLAGSVFMGYELDRWTSPASQTVFTKTFTQSVMGPTSTQTVTTTQTVNAGALEFELFADWHGDGARQNDEPLIKDAILKVSGEGRKETVQADGKGRYILSGIVDGGRYRLDFESLDSGRPYRFLSSPNGKFHPITDGYEFVGDLSKSKIPVGLMHGFLTLPFAAGTHLDRGTGYVDIAPASGKWIDWRGHDATYDGHNGTDFIIREGTKVLAAAPGTLREVFDQPEHDTCGS